MDRQVVLVCLNFRLSVLGGLYLPGGKAPGNQMMRDQVAGLHWVRDNISKFGGYVSGSGSRLLYGPELFMDRQVVLVCLNFRLSVLGGLYLPGGKAPGNQMMRDQVAG